MLFIKQIYCRTFQTGFRLAQPMLPYREPEILSCCAELEALLQREGLRTMLIVTDKGVVQNGLLAPVTQALERAGVSYFIFDGVRSNPTVENVEAALALYLEKKCEGFISVGGGSCIDCAKTAGARAVYPKRSVRQLAGKLKVRRALPPLIAIPTTAGTGSEATLAALISDPTSHQKHALMSFPLIPRFAVLDPALSVSLPPQLSSTTGMDALTHAVEAYIGRATIKETRALALEATKLVFENVETAYSYGEDIAARENMLRAAYKAGIAFSKSYVGYIHAVAHALGGMYGTPHGLANAVVMPYVLEAYGDCIHARLHRLGVAAGVCRESNPHRVGAERFIAAIREMNARMGIPAKLSGIRPEDIPELARHAEKEANPLYPVPKLMTRRELERFFIQVADWSE